MMKTRKKRMNSLKMEIEQLDETILNAERLGKRAFAKRLRLIREKKINLLDNWIARS